MLLCSLLEYRLSAAALFNSSNVLNENISLMLKPFEYMPNNTFMNAIARHICKKNNEREALNIFLFSSSGILLPSKWPVNDPIEKVMPIIDMKTRPCPVKVNEL